jgi:hypothetical protein
VALPSSSLSCTTGKDSDGSGSDGSVTSAVVGSTDGLSESALDERL